MLGYFLFTFFLTDFERGVESSIEVLCSLSPIKLSHCMKILTIALVLFFSVLMVKVAARDNHTVPAKETQYTGYCMLVPKPIELADTIRIFSYHPSYGFSLVSAPLPSNKCPKIFGPSLHSPELGSS